MQASPPEGAAGVIWIGDTDDEVPPDLPGLPGAFAWWYADVVTPAGDGAVVIWSYGLPFLPGLAAAARAGRPQRPADRPSVNVVVYRAGRPVLYLLQETAPETPGSALSSEQRIGGCTFHRSVDGPRCTLDAALDLPLPGTRDRLTGTLRIEGAARLPHRAEETRVSVDRTLAVDQPHSVDHAHSVDRPRSVDHARSVDYPSSVDPSSLDAYPSAVRASSVDQPHVWTPLTGPAAGEVALSIGGRPVARVAGRGYHDRNFGRVPLHALGIERWMWGRVPLADREAVYYLLWPEGGGPPRAVGLEIGADGRTRRLAPEVALHGERRSWTGMRRPACIELSTDGAPWLTVRHAAVADDGPFYLRLLSHVVAADGERAVGWSEVCRPARVDLPVHRPFVRMRVHRAGGPNSPWLPLFTGPRQGRVGRLMNHLLHRGHG